jgi:hypothetical protein
MKSYRACRLRYDGLAEHVIGSGFPLVESDE